MPIDLNRRTALISAAALPLAVAGLPHEGRAAAPLLGAATPRYYRFRLSGLEITTLNVGSGVSDNPQGTFGMNASPEEFAALSAANHLPADRWRNGYTPVLVNTGEALALFDTGPDAAATLAVLAEAGVDPAAVDIVVLTHMHGDHIGGLMSGGAPSFPNARYAAGRAEYDNWAAAGNARFDSNVRPLADKITYLVEGDAVLPGITAFDTPGHTPGHMSFRLESGDKAMIVTGDVVNHYVWSLARPDWEVRFDADKPGAAATRHKVLGLLADEGIPFSGYHMPFPALGFVTREGEGFRYSPASYQLLLDEG